MIYALTILFTFADVMYSKYQFIDGRKGVWHLWRLIRTIIFFGAFICFQYFPFQWTDFILCVIINAALFPLLLNKIALKQKWFYVGSTSETDKKIGKYQWYAYGAFIIVAAILKVVIKPKKKK